VSAKLNRIGSFFIKELTGEKREIELSGRALPYRPFTIAGEQAADVTWYPGNPIATVQPLGAREMETVIKGWWKDRFIGNDLALLRDDVTARLDGKQVTAVRDLAEVIDDIRRKGQLLEVAWLQHARRGLMRRFTQTWHTAGDLEYEIAFAWISQAEDAPEQLAERQVDLSLILDSMSARFNELENISPPAYGAAIDQDFADKIKSQVDKMQSSITGMADTVLSGVDGALAPLDSARRMMGLLQFAEATAGDLINDINDRLYRSGIKVGERQDIQDISVPTLTRVAAADLAMTRAARRLKHQARRDRIKVSESTDPVLVDVVFARRGQDLRDISTEYYGTPDEQGRLRRFNNLTTSELEAGQMVLVPERMGGA